jgi:hypothetical protein
MAVAFTAGTSVGGTSVGTSVGGMAVGSSVGGTAACVCSAYWAARVEAAFCTPRVEATAVATESTSAGALPGFMRLHELKRKTIISAEKTIFFIIPPYLICSTIIVRKKRKIKRKIKTTGWIGLREYLNTDRKIQFPCAEEIILASDDRESGSAVVWPCCPA